MKACKGLHMSRDRLFLDRNLAHAALDTMGANGLLLRSVTFSCSKACLGNPTKKGIFEEFRLERHHADPSTGDGSRLFLLRLWL
ncbi:hypothetical protein BO98_00095 [Candidatus Synechococcus spongiarum LMB bulk10D]|nr:hypothetical protein BO98_00095 [Candidatus Synechococcus spongiarum LMB bulk10D]